MMKKLMLMLAVLVFVGSAFAMNDHTAPYRLAFLTSTDIGVPWDLSVNLDAADAHVQLLADNAGVGATGYVVDLDGNPMDVDWKILGSTTYVDARDHTGTNPASAGVPIYLVGVMNDGVTMVATGNADLWDGTLTNLIAQDENGNAKSHWPHTGTYPDGTKSDGTKTALFGPTHGGPMDTGTIAQGNGGSNTDWVWRQWTARPTTEELPVYAISEIIPEPATMCLIGLGSLVMLRRRR
jgi:hypothetical protein